MKTHRKFTAPERDLLARCLAQGQTKTDCAKQLGRPRRSVLREINKNSSWVKDNSGQLTQVYIAISAQAKAIARQHNSAYNKHELKNPDVYVYVTAHLRRGWSPQQIAGRLTQVDHPGNPHWHICPETIYQWIYAQPKTIGGNHWYEYLRRKQKSRRQQQGRKVHHSHIPDRVSISQRPKQVNERKIFGHWEGDSIEGRRKDSAGVHTEVERMSRRIKGTKVKAITSKEAYLAQKCIFADEPAGARKSTTLDNGRETHLHYLLRSIFGMDTYHAHPYSSYERGTNEHGNWHLRYYFPKGTDFTKVTEAELQAVITEINNRPRKIHGFKTANEVYYQLLKKELGVTIGN